jgi:hypothetical protein
VVECDVHVNGVVCIGAVEETSMGSIARTTAEGATTDAANITTKPRDQDSSSSSSSSTERGGVVATATYTGNRCRTNVAG